MEKYYCDKCGKEIANFEEKIINFHRTIPQENPKDWIDILTTKPAGTNTFIYKEIQLCKFCAISWDNELLELIYKYTRAKDGKINEKES